MRHVQRAARLVRKALAPFDVGVVRLSKQSAALACRRRARFLEQERITVVLDVGAHVGEYGQSLRDNGYQGRIESFEPLPSAFERLATRRWGTHNVAVGGRSGNVNFHIASNEVSSSILPMLQAHIQGAPGSVVTGTIVVPMVTLDSMDLVTVTDRVLIKIDAQGYEHEVLHGAKETLKQTRLVEAELSLVQLYDGQVLYRELIDHLNALGFDLISLERGFEDESSGRLLQMDGIFARS